LLSLLYRENSKVHAKPWNPALESVGIWFEARENDVGFHGRCSGRSGVPRFPFPSMLKLRLRAYTETVK